MLEAEKEKKFCDKYTQRENADGDECHDNITHTPNVKWYFGLANMFVLCNELTASKLIRRANSKNIFWAGGFRRFIYCRSGEDFD